LANEAERQRRIPPPQPGAGGIPVPQPQYTQVNILFPASQVELPPAEKFNEFPPDAQKAILEAFKTEQLQRHTWLRNQQHNDHQLNALIQNNYFKWRIAGLICATLLSLAVFAIGAILVLYGAPVIGVATLVGAVAGLVGTAIYGHRISTTAQAQPSHPQKESQQ
jgi:hypothetical protein